MAPSWKSSTQAADWRRPVQTSPYTTAVYLPTVMLHPTVPIGCMGVGPSQPTSRAPLQGTLNGSVQAGYLRPPPLPPYRPFASERRHSRQPQSRQHVPRPVSQPSLPDRVVDRRPTFNPDAKPFVGASRSSPSSDAQNDMLEARDVVSAGSSHSHPKSKLDCSLQAPSAVLCGLCTGGCLATTMRLPSVLMWYAAESHVLL